MKYIFLLILLFFLHSCANLDPNENPNSQFDASNRYGELKADTLYAIDDTVMQVDYVSTGTSEKLNLADFGGLNASFFIKLTTLPDTLDKTIGVQLDFRTVEAYGSDVPDSVAVDIYTVNKTWSSLEVNTKDDFRDNPPTEFLESIYFQTNDSVRTRYNIDMTLIEQWVANEETNNGLYFKPQPGQGEYALNLGALGSSQEPQLILASDLDSIIARDSISVGPDATLFSMNTNAAALERGPHEIMMASGIPIRTFIKFDLKSLPSDAIYYYAYISLKDNEEDAYRNPGKSNQFRLRNIREASQNLETIDIDSSFVVDFERDFLLEQTSSSNSAVHRGFQREYFAENFLQPLKNGQVENEWFLIHYVDEGEDLSIKKYFGTDAPMVSNRPMLIVNYLNGK